MAKDSAWPEHPTYAFQGPNSTLPALASSLDPQRTLNTHCPTSPPSSQSRESTKQSSNLPSRQVSSSPAHHLQVTHTIVRPEIPHDKHSCPRTHGQRDNRHGQEDAIDHDKLGPLVFRVDKVGCLARGRGHGRGDLGIGHVAFGFTWYRVRVVTLLYTVVDAYAGYTLVSIGKYSNKQPDEKKRKEWTMDKDGRNKNREKRKKKRTKIEQGESNKL